MDNVATRSSSSHAAWACLAALAVVMVGGLWIGEQPLWCAHRDAAVWIGDIWSIHNSQHLADPYSFSHLSHGLILALCFMVRLPAMRRLPFAWRLCLGAVVEAAWELIENTDLVIHRYRDSTLALGYTGDTIVNSLGDLGCFILGFLLAARVGWRWSAAIIVAIDAVMLVCIRDNLALNVLMLIWPIDAVKQWQLG